MSSTGKNHIELTFSDVRLMATLLSNCFKNTSEFLLKSSRNGLQMPSETHFKNKPQQNPQKTTQYAQNGPSWGEQGGGNERGLAGNSAPLGSWWAPLGSHWAPRRSRGRFWDHFGRHFRLKGLKNVSQNGRSFLKICGRSVLFFTPFWGGSVGRVEPCCIDSRRSP